MGTRRRKPSHPAGSTEPGHPRLLPGEFPSPNPNGSLSHLLTFDVQVHQGVLQVLTGGAGRTRGTLHCVQAALDSGGLRYQVLDTSGAITAWLEWPLHLPPSEGWLPFGPGDEPQKLPGDMDGADSGKFMVVWCFPGVNGPSRDGEAETLLCGWDDRAVPAPVWIGLLGRERRVSVLLSRAPGRSPGYWLVPTLPPNEPFTVQLAFHTGMGPGGVLWRREDGGSWSSLSSASSYGLERIPWPGRWSAGHGQRGATDRPFRGRELRVTWHAQAQQLDQRVTS